MLDRSPFGINQVNLFDYNAGKISYLVKRKSPVLWAKDPKSMSLNAHVESQNQTLISSVDLTAL